jgi:cytokinesis protein
VSTRNDEFHFPRPADRLVEELFAQLVENRDLDNNNVVPVPSSMSSRHSTQSVASAVARTTATLNVNTKWQMVEADARSRWETEKRRKFKEDEAVRMGRGRKSAAALSRDSPQYIIRKVLDNQLSKSHLSTLNVSLRTQPLE